MTHAQRPKREQPELRQGRPFLYRETPMQARRAAPAEGKTELRVFSVAISSETPVLRYDWWSGEEYYEVLGHGAGEVKLERINAGAALLVDHRGDQVGKVMNGSVRVEGRVMRGKIRPSRSARGQEIADDIEDETREGISVGYFPGENWKPEGTRDGIPVRRYVGWEPAEVSLAGVPADITVGVGRSADRGASPRKEQAVTMPQEEGTVVPPERGMLRSQQELQYITQMAKANARFGALEKLPEWIERGLSSRQVDAEILNMISTRGGISQPAAELLDPLDGMPMRDRRRFSVPRAILGAATAREHGRAMGGIEGEMHQELERRLGRAKHGGILVPYAPARNAEQMHQLRQRTLESGVGGKGSEFVTDSVGDFIEMLRTTPVMAELGASFIPGLSGPLTFTKQVGAMTAQWMGENPTTGATKTDIALGLAQLAPKTLIGYGSFSRQLLVQAAQNWDLEDKVNSDFAEIHVRAIDRAGIHGTGSNGEPTGIYQAPDVVPVAVGTIATATAYTKLINDMVGGVASRNVDVRKGAFLTTPVLAAKLMTTLVASSAGSDMIWTGTHIDGRVGGYRAMSSNQVSSTMSGSAPTGGTDHGLIFGNWPDLIVGLFMVLEIVVDPFKLKEFGVIELSSFQMADILLRHGESFAKGTGAN